MRRFLFENSLSIFFFVILVATLVGQSIAGHAVYNADQLDHHEQTITYWRYLVSSHFGQAVMENWESEFLQFSLFILATVWLIQKGSAESKEESDIGAGSDQEQKVKGYADRGAAAWAKARDFRLWLYSNSLLIAMTTIFFLTWFAQSVTGWNEFNSDRKEHGDPQVGWAGYVGDASFWEDTFQNWQSEFLAVGTMAVFTIYLRQRGSPESKPVGASHDQTGSDV
jgi:uncharacterized MAPEG superfamily protein